MSARLIRNVVLLSLLDDIAEKPKKNAPSEAFAHQGARILTFDQEREICTALAWIAGVSSYPGHVMAVAIEERHDPECIHVKLSINKSYSAEPAKLDGRKVLNKVKYGLQKIFRVLKRAAKGKV